MHDLRHDPNDPQDTAANGAAPTPHTPPPITTPTGTQRAQRLDPSDLRTATPVDLRTPEARLLDAVQRGLDGDGHGHDVRTFPEMVVAELVRLVDAMQGLSLRQDVFEEELTARRAVVDGRLTRLEESLKRIADSVQIMALERDRKGV